MRKHRALLSAIPLLLPLTALAAPEATLLMPASQQTRVPGQTYLVTRWGYQDAKGNWVIPPTFEEAGDFAGGCARVARQGRWGFIDAAGKPVVPPQYAEAQDFAEGLAAVNTGSRDQPAWGFVDAWGKLVVPGRYLDVRPFAEGLSGVETAGHRWGLVDRSGTVVVEPRFKDVGTFTAGMAPVVTEEGAGLMDRTGKVLWLLKGASWVRPEGALYEFTMPDGYGLADRAGHVVAEPQDPGSAGWHLDFAEGLEPLLIKGKYGYVTKENQLAIPPLFDQAQRFTDHLAPVKLGDKWGYIDRTGAVVVPARYDEVRRFGEGLAGVRIGAKWGFIDRTGKLVIAPRFDDVQSFAEGLCVAMVTNTATQSRNLQLNGYIDKTGAWVLQPRWVHAEAFRQGLAVVATTYSDSALFLIDRQGRTVGDAQEARRRRSQRKASGT